MTDAALSQFASQSSSLVTCDPEKRRDCAVGPIAVGSCGVLWTTHQRGGTLQCCHRDELSSLKTIDILCFLLNHIGSHVQAFVSSLRCRERHKPAVIHVNCCAQAWDSVTALHGLFVVKVCSQWSRRFDGQ